MGIWQSEIAPTNQFVAHLGLVFVKEPHNDYKRENGCFDDWRENTAPYFGSVR